MLCAYSGKLRSFNLNYNVSSMRVRGLLCLLLLLPYDGEVLLKAKKFIIIFPKSDCGLERNSSQIPDKIIANTFVEGLLY